MENLAGLGRRFFAYLVDWYIGALVTAFPVSAVSMKLFETVKNQNLLTFPAPWGLIAGGLGLAAAVLYYAAVPILVWRGQTLGKRWMKIKIADSSGGEASAGQLIDTIVRMVQIDSVEAEAEPDAPFSGYQKDGVIYSRGVLDNKGPIFSCLYALYALKELGIVPDRQVRILFGCDEETGFEDLNYYLSKEKPPVMGFTPDCKYPVVYAERGRALVEIRPASRERFYTLMNDYVLNAKNNGERFHIDFRDEEFGQVEVRNFKILPEEGQGDGSAASVPSLQFAVSYPAGCTAAQILETVRGELPDMEAELISNMDPVRFEKDCRLVDTLRYTYERVTGMDGTPVTTTGGTYAKRMPNIVPFGPSFPGQKGIGHQPDEWMKVDDIVANAKIYALSLYYLAKDVEMERK